MNLDEIEARANAATPGPWMPPTQRERGPGCDDRACVVDHEGCAVWPWHRREDMEFAYATRSDVPALIARVRELEAECDEALDDYQDMRQKMNDECAKLEKERDEARKEAAAWALRVVELARANEQLAQERADFKLRAEDEIANNVVNLNAHRNQTERLKKLETDIRDHVSHTGGNGLAALEDLAEEVRKTWVSVDDECIEMRAECERMKTFAAQNFSTMIRQEAEQMRAYGLSYEGVRKVLHEYDDGEISFGKLMDLIRAAARAMAEPTVTYSEGETLLRAQAAEAQQLARQMMDERDKLRAECAALRRELAALMDDH